MAENFQEKTEQPTDKRLDDAKKKGQIAQSRELSSSFIILGSTLLLSFIIVHVFNEMFRTFVTFVRNSNYDVDVSNIYSIVTFSVYRWAWLVAPVFGFLLLITAAGSVLQTGFNFSTEALKFSPEKLNPVEGIKRLFNKRSVVEVLKSVAKIFVLAYISYSLIIRELPRIFALPGQDIHAIISYLGNTAFSLALKVGIAILFIAALDFMYQKWQHKKDLMMTQQEVKEEMKEREGNPLIKSRIRTIQREMARARMMEDVKTADVIVTNPTHYAVALKYTAGAMPAPKVVAKGAGFVAMRIKEIAFNFKVPVIENKPLAQGLFHMANVGDFIPEKFYIVVAELLAEVYRRKGKVRVS